MSKGCEEEQDQEKAGRADRWCVMIQNEVVGVFGHDVDFLVGSED